MTAQLREVLIINGKKLLMASTPPLPVKSGLVQEDYRNFGIGLFEYPKRNTNSSACWRKYIGTWEIVNHKLYLMDVEGNYKTAIDGPIFANWFSGILRIQCGKLIKFVDKGFSSTYETEISIKVKNGDLVEPVEILNNAPSSDSTGTQESPTDKKLVSLKDNYFLTILEHNSITMKTPHGGDTKDEVGSNLPMGINKAVNNKTFLVREVNAEPGFCMRDRRVMIEGLDMINYVFKGILQDIELGSSPSRGNDDRLLTVPLGFYFKNTDFLDSYHRDGQARTASYCHLNKAIYASKTAAVKLAPFYLFSALGQAVEKSLCEYEEIALVKRHGASVERARHEIDESFKTNNWELGHKYSELVKLAGEIFPGIDIGRKALVEDYLTDSFAFGFDIYCEYISSSQRILPVSDQLNLGDWIDLRAKDKNTLQKRRQDIISLMRWVLRALYHDSGRKKIAPIPYHGQE